MNECLSGTETGLGIRVRKSATVVYLLLQGLESVCEHRVLEVQSHLLRKEVMHVPLIED